MYRRTLLFLLLSMVLQVGIAAMQVADTLQFSRLLHQFERTQRVEEANRLFQFLEAEDFLDEPIRFDAQTPSDTLFYQVWYWAAEYLNDRQQYARAVDYALKALPYCQRSKNPYIEGDCLSVLTIAYIRLGDFNHAAPCAKRLYTLDLKSGDMERISSSLNTLAAVYQGAGYVEQAYTYVTAGIEKCIAVGNQARLAILYGSAAEISFSMGEYERAIDYGKRALQIDERAQRTGKVAIRLAQIAPSYIALHRYAEAEQALLKAIPVLLENENQHSYAIASNQMGKLYLEQKRYEEALKYYYQALDVFEKQADAYNESHTRLGLYQVLSHIRPEEAIVHNDRYRALHDSLYDSRTGLLMAEYAAQYGNSALQAENQEIMRTHRVHILLILSAVLLLALLTYFIGVYRRKQIYQSLPASADTSTHHSSEAEQLQSASATDHAPQQLHTTASSDAEFCTSVRQVVKATIEEGSVDVERIASRLGLSSSTLRRRIMAMSGKSTKAFITSLQMEKAAELLRDNPSLTMEEVAAACAFTSASSFTRAFKQYYGMPPTAYAKQSS